MFIYLKDRTDRLGTNIILYIAQILFAHKNQYEIRYKKDPSQYSFHSSVFVQMLFKYIVIYNKKLVLDNTERNEMEVNQSDDFITLISNCVQILETDLVSYFHVHVFPHIQEDVIALNEVFNVPFEIDRTIVVHLRLDDTAHLSDYDGSSCANYYRDDMNNKNTCIMQREKNNNSQAPLSKEKLLKIINGLEEDYKKRDILLLTSPISDTSFLPYQVIKSQDENYDLYLLSVAKVVVLSRSQFAFSSLFFNKLENKEKMCIPLWGHNICFGLDTKYDCLKDKCTYFY